MRNVVHTGREAQPRLELTGIAPNSRQQSKTVNIKAHIRNEQSCIDEFEVVFVWQNRANGKRKHDLWLLAPYIKHTDRDKRAERYTIFQPRIKSWTSTIIWDKYNVIFFFLVSYVSGTLWCSRIWNSILSHRGQSLTLNECCSTECTNQTVSWNIHKIKNNTDIRECSLSVHQMRMSFVTTATAEYSFRIILGPIRLIIKQSDVWLHPALWCWCCWFTKS